MDYIKEKYILFASSQLRNFKKKSNNYNFSCPFCNDSQTHKSKARAYLIDKGNEVFFKCFNCDIPLGNFVNFLKKLDHSLYTEYLQETVFKNTRKETDTVGGLQYKYEPLIIPDKGFLASVNSLDKLDLFDPVKRYVVERQIPEKYFSDLYSVVKFKKFTNSIIKNKFDQASLEKDEMRLLIPFFDEDKKMFAFSGRSLEKTSKLRYINITIDETKPKIYGLDRLDKSKTSYVVEGPIDSLFLNNCIATSGGVLTSHLNPDDNLIIVYDNEPRSYFTRQKIKKAIQDGFKVCIWPSDIVFKDINQMILGGYTSEKIEEIIKANSVKGLEADLRLAFWGK